MSSIDEDTTVVFYVRPLLNNELISRGVVCAYVTEIRVSQCNRRRTAYLTMF